MTLSRLSPINRNSAPRAIGIGPKLLRETIPLSPVASFLHEIKIVLTNTKDKAVNSSAIFICFMIFLYIANICFKLKKITF